MVDLEQLKKDVDANVSVNRLTWYRLLDYTLSQKRVIEEQRKQLLVQARRIEQLNAMISSPLLKD